MSSNTHCITFDANKKHEIIIENYEHGSSQKQQPTFFTEEYDKASELVKEILDAWRKEDVSSDTKRNPDCSGSKNGNLQNNIILFSGERGTGKTSAMKSFGHFLNKEGLKGSQDHHKYRFKLLPMIDPSYFRKNENIVINVISVMFKMAKCIHNNESKAATDYNKDDFNKLLREYEKVFTALKNMDELRINDQSLEYLNELADSTDLGNKIHSLIKKMLDFIHQDKSEKNKSEVMVLMIDDLDMNVSHAPLMLEQIRKFLIMENLIILMSSNIDQFQLEMEECYSKEFKQLLTYPDEWTVVSSHIEDMATQYLLKLFPPSRRIHVENAAKKLLETNIEIKLKDGDKNIEDVKKYNKQPLQNAILHLIWSRTRLIFVPEDGQLHPIIPTNLRALQQLMFLLLDMNEISGSNNKQLFTDKDVYIKVQNNFNNFKDYVLETWIPSNVSFEEQKVFDNIPTEITRINKYLIQSINVIGNQHRKRLLTRDVDLIQIEKNSTIKIDSDIYTMVSPNDPKFYMANRISDIYNYPSNNSMGDVLLLIDKYKTYFESVAESRFIDAVKIYYTMLLFETMFFKSKISIKKENEDQEKKKDEIIDIQKLIGGTVYFQHYFDIITCDDYKVELSEEYDRGRGDHLFYHQYNMKDKPDKQNNCNEFANFSEIFYVLYYGEKRPDRTLNKHIYDTEKKEGDMVRFDILSLLSNILNPLHTLKRFGIKTNIEEKDGTVASEIKKWLEKVELHSDSSNEKCETFEYPNFILPIYSVDIMLIYLRRQYKIEEIQSDLKNIGTKIEILHKIKSSLKHEKQIKKDKKDKEDQRIKEIFDANFEIIRSANMAQGENFKPTTHSQFKELLKVLQLNKNKKSNDTEKTVNLSQATCVVDLNVYKCQVIDALVMYYLTDTNDRVQKMQRMIQKIQEMKSKIEIMFYLISELWEKEYQITVIHDAIQEEVRTPNFISNYYEKLWELTNKAFEKIELQEGKPNEITPIYKSIYEAGRDVFIKE